MPGPLSRAGGRQGQDEHAPRRAPGARRQPLPVGELAAAALQRPRQPAPVDRDGAKARAARTPTTMPSCLRRWPTSRRRIRSTPSSRTGWSTTGACAGCCRRASPRCTAHRHARESGALRRAAAGRPPAGHAGAARRTRACASRSAASTCSTRRSSAATPGRSADDARARQALECCHAGGAGRSMAALRERYDDGMRALQCRDPLTPRCSPVPRRVAQPKSSAVRAARWHRPLARGAGRASPAVRTRRAPARAARPPRCRARRTWRSPACCRRRAFRPSRSSRPRRVSTLGIAIGVSVALHAVRDDGAFHRSAPAA